MISVQKTACMGKTSQMPPQIIRLKTVSACCDGDRLQTCWAVVKKNQKKQKTNWHCTSVRQETPGDLGKAESPLQLSSDRTRCMALGKSISLLFTGMASIMGSKGLFDQVPRRQRYRQKRTRQVQGAVGHTTEASPYPERSGKASWRKVLLSAPGQWAIAGWAEQPRCQVGCLTYASGARHSICKLPNVREDKACWNTASHYSKNENYSSRAIC